MLTRLFERLESWAGRMQGKGWGAATTQIEAETIRRLLDRYRRPEPKVVIDVGANVGNWTSAARPLFPEARFLLFEPSPKNIEILNGRFHDARISIFPLALSNKQGRATLFSDFDGSGLAGLEQRDLTDFGNDHKPLYEVETSTLAAIAAAENLSQIDILKIDVEGHDLAVLQGAGGWLEKTGLIQFEFGGANIDSRVFLRDFWRLLHPRFDLYRLAQWSPIPITTYSERIESFRICNYLAIQSRA